MVFHRIRLFTVIIFVSPLLLSQVIITEVMYSPANSNAEFVELYNTSSTTSYDLASWTITDNNSTDDFVDTGDGLTLLPNSYAVIVENDYTGVYDSIIPSNAIIIEVDDKSIGNGLSAIDSLKLKDPINLIELLKWTDIASDNHSIERIRLENPNTSDNWSQSEDSLGTPGGENSVTPLPIDGAINGDVIFSPARPDKTDNVVALVPILNAGLNNISGTLTASVNGNYVGSKSIGTMLPEETKNHYLSISALPSGRHNIIFELSIAGDGDLSNNTASKKLGISYDPGVIQINEFHAEPGDGQSEFIELVVARSIVIDGWHIRDKSSTRLLPITYIENNEYVILASDSSLNSVSNPDAKYLIPYGGLPTLNNSGDNLYLVDMNHTIIDSLVYGSGWPVTTDSSAEKLNPFIASNDPLNWKVSVDPIGMTPGYVNSNYLSNYDGEIIADSIVINPMYPKYDESFQLTIPLTNHGSEKISGILNIFDTNNTSVASRTVTDIARRDTVNFVFEFQPMASGIHPLTFILEIADDSNSSNNTVIDTVFVSYKFGDILINEFLPGPTSTQAEFVELYSNVDVDMFQWSIEDATRNAKTFSGGNVAEETFVVLSEDNAFSIIIPPEAVFVEVKNFPSLNNYGDAIYLRDFTDTVIDSLVYTTWWELETGISTEKIHPQLTSADSTAWLLSVDATAMTPGRTNSVVVKNIDGTILLDSIYTYPKSPEGNTKFQLVVPILNNGLESISGVVTIEQYGARILNYIINNIDAGESLYCNLDIQPMPSGIQSVNIILEIDGDEDIADNSCEYDVKVSYQFGDVTINEFCADPEAPLFEFVELFTVKDIDLYGWQISDNRKEPLSFGNHDIGKDTYIILSEENNYDMSQINAVYYPIDNFPSLNNSGDGIYLYDYNGKVIDSLVYDNSNWPIESGQSTEKIFPSYISDNPDNWQVCIDPFGATFGLANSVLLQTINGTILTALTTHYPEFPHPSESIAFSIRVKNTGIDDISGVIRLMHYNTEIGSADFSNLSTQDTANVTLNIDPLPSGQNYINIILEILNDMNSSDNSIDYEVYVSFPFGAVMLNEFLADPDSLQAEFVEIISFSDVDLSGWSISDNTYKQYYFSAYFSYADSPSVVTADSLFAVGLDCDSRIIYTTNGWPTLNNESDGIFLYDPTDTVIDSLNYDSNWPIAKGRSTEKYRPEFESNDVKRWGIAVNRAAMTPGQENSVYFDELPKDGSMVFDQNPFSPDGDGVDDELLIKYKLPFEQGILKLQIFDVTGRCVATPYWNVYFPQEGILRWDGHRDNGEQARIGIYILKLSARNPFNSDTWEKVKTVVLAKQL